MSMCQRSNISARLYVNISAPVYQYQHVTPSILVHRCQSISVSVPVYQCEYINSMPAYRVNCSTIWLLHQDHNLADMAATFPTPPVRYPIA